MIEIDSLSKTFRRTPALDALSMSVERGERVALIGSNGAGKTTLIRCLLGEYTYQGSISIGGLQPRRDRQTILRQVGFVPQLPPPLGMPVAQLIDFAAGVCGSDAARVKAVGGELGLDVDQIRRQPFIKLSGGQKQKLLIAIALGRDSDILFMDEPAANLDPEARRIFLQLLAERQDDSVMLISSHRLDEVASLVNRVVELDRGKLVLDDCVEEADDLTEVLACRITLRRADSAFAAAIKQWDFSASLEDTVWSGDVAGADRLRFLGTVSRYAGALRAVTLGEHRS